MGNTTSTEQSDIGNLATQIDEIAVQYILNQNTIDLLRLTDKEYYDNLIILTGNVIEKKLNHLELGFLNQRIFGKSTVGEILDIVPANNKLKEKVIFNISKFYIKIIMIYSAIATTIDPQYAYEDENGFKKLFYLKDMDAYKHIPKSVKPVLVQLTNPLNLCRKRLSILKNKMDFNVDDLFVKINPGEKLCSLSTTNLLTDEVGIKELDALYYDIFDYDTKSWSKRSKKMKIKYNKDLILFYQIFTGKKVKPAEIKSFHDIELLDMSTIEQCNDVRFMQDILVKKNDVLIQQYIQKINMIEDTTRKYKSKLVGILKELFVIKSTDNESIYTINPELTLDHIILIETETRDTILNLYTSCEKYFIQALIIFEKIYDEQVKTLNVERINYIDKIKTPPPEVIEQTPEPVFMPEEQIVSEPFVEPISTPEPPLFGKETPLVAPTVEPVSQMTTVSPPTTVSLPVSGQAQVGQQAPVIPPEPVSEPPVSTPELESKPDTSMISTVTTTPSVSPPSETPSVSATPPVSAESISPPANATPSESPPLNATPPVSESLPPSNSPPLIATPASGSDTETPPVSGSDTVTPPVSGSEKEGEPKKNSIFTDLFNTITNTKPSPPVNATPPPVNSNPPPVNATPPPVNATPPPVNATPPPVNSNPPPVNSNPPPVNATPPPVNATPPPVNSNPPPVNATPPPVNSNPPPVNATPPPVNSNPPKPL
jgi:hypothetical protein